MGAVLLQSLMMEGSVTELETGKRILSLLYKSPGDILEEAQELLFRTYPPPHPETLQVLVLCEMFKRNN